MTTELENLLAVFRAVDDGLAADPQRTDAVAELLPPYAGGAATGWVGAVERWAARRPGECEPVRLPDVDAALATLAETPPAPGLAPRRVLALGALARAQPDRFGPGAGDRAHLVDAVRPVATTSGIGEPETLLDLTPEGPAGPVGLSGPVARDTSLVHVGSGRGPDVRAVVATEVAVPGLDGDRARRAIDVYFEPANWPSLLPERWNGMRPLDPPPEPPPAGGEPTLPFGERRRYEEQFRVTGWLQLTPVLEFLRSRLQPGAGGAQVLEYRLADGANDDDLVVRDSGAMVAQFTGAVLRVRTTKRIRFRPPFDGPGLAMFAGVLGYLDAAERMLLQAIDETAPAGGPDAHPHR
jgi:hypothetical protein